MNCPGKEFASSILATAVASLLLTQAGPAPAVPLVFTATTRSTHLFDTGQDNFEDLQEGVAPVSAAVPHATAMAGTGLITATASGTASRVGIPFNNTILQDVADSSASVEWKGPSLDPREAGVFGRLTYAITGSTETAATGLTGAFASARYDMRTRGQTLADEGISNLACLPGCSTAGSRPFVPAEGSFLVQAGADLRLSISASAQPSIAVSSSGALSASAAASVSLTYTLEVFEDRRHWVLPGAGALDVDVSWVEQAAPDATSWAVFNSTAGRSLALTVPGPTSWRGLIVDGETVNLDLAGQTLTMGSAGPSLKTYSIRVGEGRSSASLLTLRNGNVVADNDVLVGAIGGSLMPLATLTVDGGAVLTQRQSAGLASIAVGDTGPGALVVRGGSKVFTNLLALASRAPTGSDPGPLRATLDIAGAGTRVEAVQVSLAARGDATATVRDGAVLQAQSMDLAAQTGSTATLTIDGVGSQLHMTGGFVTIGERGRATLQVSNGASIEGNSSTFSVGSGDPALFSVLRLSGAGTRLTEAGVQVNAGGLFEVRERAEWTGASNLLAVTGGRATFRDVTAKLNVLTVEGKFNGPNLLATGQVDIEQGSFIDAANADITINKGGRLTITGSGTRLTGFGNLRVNSGGALAVNLGSTLEGETLGLDVGAVLQGTGTVKVNNRFTVEGDLRPGNSPGLLRVEGNVTLTRTSRLVLELAGTTPGSQHDVLQVTGSLDLQGGQIDLSFIDGFAPRLGDQFVLLDVGGSFANGASLQVTGLEPGWLFNAGFDVNTGQLTVSSLNDGVSAVPEVSRWVMLAAGLVLLRRLTPSRPRA